MHCISSLTYCCSFWEGSLLILSHCKCQCTSEPSPSTGLIDDCRFPSSSPDLVWMIWGENSGSRTSISHDFPHSPLESSLTPLLCVHLTPCSIWQCHSPLYLLLVVSNPVSSPVCGGTPSDPISSIADWLDTIWGGPLPHNTCALYSLNYWPVVLVLYGCIW